MINFITKNFLVARITCQSQILFQYNLDIFYSQLWFWIIYFIQNDCGVTCHICIGSKMTFNSNFSLFNATPCSKLCGGKLILSLYQPFYRLMKNYILMMLKFGSMFVMWKYFSFYLVFDDCFITLIVVNQINYSSVLSK